MKAVVYDIRPRRDPEGYPAEHIAASGAHLLKGRHVRDFQRDQARFMQPMDGEKERTERRHAPLRGRATALA